MTETHHPAVTYIKIDPANKFAIRPRCNNNRVADQDRLRQCIMRVTSQDHINSIDAFCHFLVDVEPIVRQTNNQFSPLPADLIDHFLHALITNTE